MSSRLDQNVGMTTSGHGAADAVFRENLAASAMRCAHSDMRDGYSARRARPPVKERVRSELDRTAVSFRKAGAADYVSATFRSDGVKLNGPPREHPRRSWLRPEWQLLEWLAVLPDDAGVRAVWRTLGGN